MRIVPQPSLSSGLRCDSSSVPRCHARDQETLVSFAFQTQWVLSTHCKVGQMASSQHSRTLSSCNNSEV